MGFEVIGNVTGIEIIAVGSGIRMASQLRKRYGKARWRKLKGTARVRLSDGTVRVAEIHWFQAHGVGKKKI
jgi:hypothetical protein